MPRLLTTGLACLGLLAVYGFLDGAAPPDLAHTGSQVNQAIHRLRVQVKALDDSPLSREMAAWARHVPGPSPEDLLHIPERVDRLLADPQMSNYTWAAWQQDYAALCRDQINPHLPQALQCGPAHGVQ